MTADRGTRLFRGAQAVYLDGRYEDKNFNHADPATWKPNMRELAEAGVKILAPPTWMLVALNDKGEIVPSTRGRPAPPGSTS